MEKNFDYVPNNHYLFSDGKVRVCEDLSPKMSRGVFSEIYHPYRDRVKGTLCYAEDGVAAGCTLEDYPKIPHILLCIEDPTTWDWKMTSPQGFGGNFEAKITVDGREYLIERNPTKFYSLKKDGECVVRNQVLRFIIFEYLLPLLKNPEVDKISKLKAEYEKLMRQAQTIQKQIDEI